jgi:TRAP-type C4-dicarboxylate transport system substrate-binding protein
LRIRKIEKVFVSAFAAAFVVAAVGSSLASAKEYKLTAGSSHPPILPWVSTIKDFVVPQSNVRLKEIGSGDTIKWTEAYAGALYDFNNTLEGVQNGLADIGWVGTLWEPVKMPLHNVTYYAPFVTGDIHLLLKVQEQLETLDAMKAQWTKYNQVFLGSQVADTYHLITTFPVRSMEDIKGKKFIAGGAIASWLENTGAVAVNGGLPVFYNNIKTGVVDGAVILATGMLPFKLHEVAPYITKIDIGAVISGGLTMNKDTWDSLPPHMKILFKGLGRDYGRIQTDIVDGNAKKFMAIMESQGAKISEFTESERVKWATTLPDIAGNWVRENEANGLPAKEVLKTVMNAVRESGGKPVRDWDKGL